MSRGISTSDLSDKSNASKALLWFAFILILKHNTLLQPPVWDTSMGTFPPAIYLYHNNFDIITLTKLPGWWDGGPNVHSFSIVTWVTAVIMTVTHNPTTTFLFLHLLTFAITAWALNNLFHIALILTGNKLIALFCCFATFFLPIVFVQTGYMYTEIPVLACSIASINAWTKHRLKSALTWCLIGLLTKATAITTTICIGLGILFSPHIKMRRRYLFILSTLSILIIISPQLLIAGTAPPKWPGNITEHLSSLTTRLLLVPDLCIMLATSVAISFFRWKSILLGLRDASLAGHKESANSMAMLIPTIFFAGTIFQVVVMRQIFLPRYTTIAIPFAILSISIYFLQDHKPQTIALFLLFSTTFFLINQNGKFYPPSKTSFSIVERSNQYRHFHNIQIQGLNALADKPEEVPGFYCRPDQYMASDYMMGYLDRPIPNTYPIYIEPYRSKKLKDFPEHFYLLRSNAAHGGEIMDDLISQIRADPTWTVRQKRFHSNGYSSTLYEAAKTKHF